MPQEDGLYLSITFSMYFRYQIYISSNQCQLRYKDKMLSINRKFHERFQLASSPFSRVLHLIQKRLDEKQN